MRNDNKIYLGDNLQVIRNHIADRSIDLIYLDPPFASDADYTYVSANPIPGQTCNSVTAFVDTWEWTSESTLILDDLTGKFQYWAESSNITSGGEGQAGKESDRERAFPNADRIASVSAWR